MNEYNAKIIGRYDFTNSQGKHIKTSKFRVNLGEYGLLDVNCELGFEIPIFSSVKVALGYDTKKNKVIITEIKK